MLYLIGIGLGNEKDLTLNELETIKSCDIVYLETYTSKLSSSVSDLEKLVNKKIISADRNFVENKNEIIENSKEKKVAFLVKGDVFSATTHVDLFLRAKKAHVKCKVLHNSSVFTAVGDTGLSLYKFGRIASIPFDNDNIDSAYKVLLENKDLHTLLLLDLRPEENKYMDFKEGLKYLLKKRIKDSKKAVICAGLGTDQQEIKYGKIKDLLKISLDIYPQCLIIPGKLHFIEEEMLNSFRI